MAFQSSAFAAPAPISPQLIKLCPVFDIVAIVSSERRIDGFRFDHTQAFTWELRTSRQEVGHQITSIAWQPDGLFLWTVWSDGQAQSVDTRTGKSSSLIAARPQTSAATQISSHKSSSCLLHEERIRSTPQLQRSQAPRSLIRGNSSTETTETTSVLLPGKDLAGHGSPSSKTIHSLPRLIALIDLQDELPTLSPLPHVDDKTAFGTYAPNRFVNQTEIDNALPRSKAQPSEDMADISEISWNDGTTTFLASSLTGSKALLSFKNAHVTSVSHTFSSCQAFLAQNSSEAPSLHMVSSNAIQKSDPYFHFIPRYNVALDSLAQYILHCIAAIRQAFRASQDLPARFLSIVSEDLAASDQPWHLDATLYHQAVTGGCHPIIKEWLLDSLQERGHKRWDAAVSQGYADIVRLLHIYLLPALERGSVVASKLRGLSHMHPPHVLFTVPPRNMTRIMDNLDMLRLLATQVLHHASEELKMFAVFSDWLGEQLTLQKAEPDSATAKETLERIAGINYPLLLNYIEGPLLRSRLNYFLGRTSLEIVEARRRPADQLNQRFMTMILEKHNRESTQPKPKAEGGAMEAANLLWQGLMLQDSIHVVRDAPNQGFEREIDVVSSGPMSPGAALSEDAQCAAADLRMVVEDPESGLLCTYAAIPLPTAFTPSAAPRPIFTLHRTVHKRHLEPLPHANSDTDADGNKTRRLPSLIATSPAVAPQARAPGTLVAIRLVSDDVLLALFSSGPTLQLWLSTFGREAGHAITPATASSASSPSHTQTQDWTVPWRLVKEWTPAATAADDDFVPQIGGVQARLVPVADGGETVEFGRIVLVVLGRDAARYLTVVATV